MKNSKSKKKKKISNGIWTKNAERHDAVSLKPR